MSRIRSIHPGLWTDERFVSVQPLARLLFMGIWNECDDQGFFEWSPLKLKMRLLPADNSDAAELLDELEAIGSIMRYRAEGKSFGAVRNFTKYQRPKKPNSVHPSTPLATAFAAGNGEPVPNQLPTEEEEPPQRKEEGGRMEEEDEAAPHLRAAALPLSPASDFWNENAIATGWPTVKRLSDGRKAGLRARLRDEGLDGWKAAVIRARSSPYLGHDPPSWFTFDWIIKPANFLKLIEGNYDRNRSDNRPASGWETAYLANGGS